jgi:hypothetical protein
MPQHSNGETMSQPSVRNMWGPVSEFWSANRAEHRFADGYELVVFDLPAANGYPAGKLFGGPEFMTRVASGQATSFGEAKDVCEAALVQALATDTLRRRPKPACSHQWRENSRERLFLLTAAHGQRVMAADRRKTVPKRRGLRRQSRYY